MSSDVVHHIKDLFNSGLLPGAAHREFLKHVRSTCKDDIEYHLKLSDRSAVPRRNDFNNIYGEFNRKAYGTESLSAMFECLHQRVAALKHENQDYSLTVQEFDEKMNQPFILVIITPLMKRIHKMVTSVKKVTFVHLIKFRRLKVMKFWPGNENFNRRIL